MSLYGVQGAPIETDRQVNNFDRNDVWTWPLTFRPGNGVLHIDPYMLNVVIQIQGYEYVKEGVINIQADRWTDGQTYIQIYSLSQSSLPQLRYENNGNGWLDCYNEKIT